MIAIQFNGVTCGRALGELYAEMVDLYFSTDTNREDKNLLADALGAIGTFEVHATRLDESLRSLDGAPISESLDRFNQSLRALEDVIHGLPPSFYKLVAPDLAKVVASRPVLDIVKEAPPTLVRGDADARGVDREELCEHLGAMAASLCWARDALTGCADAQRYDTPLGHVKSALEALDDVEETLRPILARAGVESEVAA